MAIQAWVKHDGESQEGAVIVRKGNGYRLELAGSGEEVPLRFQISGSGFDSMTSNSGIPADRWTHVTAIYDGNEMQIYIDGDLDATKSEDSGIGSGGSSPLRIGTNPSGSEQFFSGKIDDVRVWDTSLSRFQVKTNPYTELSGDESGLAAYYTFDGSESGTAVDQAGDSDLSLQATASKSTPDAFPVTPDVYVKPANTTVEGEEGTVQSNAVRAVWDERLGETGENTADSVRLYRSTSPDGSDREFVAEITSDDQYLNTGLSNRTYYYEVTSVIDGSESDYSKAKVVRPYDERGGSSLDISGDAYAELSNRPSKDLNIGSPALTGADTGNPFTVEMWVKHDGTSDDDATIIRNGGGWRLRFAGSGEERPVYFQTTGSGFDSLRSNGGIPANEWTHLAVSYTGSQMKIFINGELDASRNEDSGSSGSGSSLLLGARSGGDSNHLSAKIDELRLWSDARDEDEIQGNYTQELLGNEPGLNGYWRFDNDGATEARGSGLLGGTISLEEGAAIEPPGTFPVPPRAYAEGNVGEATVSWSERVPGETDEINVYRADGADADRELIAQLDPGIESYTDPNVSSGQTYYYDVTRRDGEFTESDSSIPATATVDETPAGNAFQFPVAQNAYASVTNRPSLALQDKTMTIEAWVKYDADADERPTIIRRNGGWRLELLGSGDDRTLSFQPSRSGFDQITSNSGIPAGEWTHVAATYDGNEMALYIDGERDASTGEDAGIQNPGANITIGTVNSANSNFYAGQIDELRVWDTARTAEEISETYNAKLRGDESGLVGYWRGCNVDGNAEARGSAVRPMTATLNQVNCVQSQAPVGRAPNADPTVNLSFSPEAPVSGEVVRLDASESADSDGAIVQYDWEVTGPGINDRTTTTANSVLAEVFPESGTYDVTVTVTDDDGATNETSTSVSVRAPNEEPTAAFSRSPLQPAPGETVTFDASQSIDNDGQVIEYQWQFAGGGLNEGPISRQTPTIERSFPNPDEQVRVTLTVVDTDGGVDTATQTFAVAEQSGDEDSTETPDGGLDNSAPTAELSIEPTIAVVGQTIRFDASGSSDTDGNIIEYRFDLDGDGTTDVTRQRGSTGTVFRSPGFYSPSVTVVDDDGATATASGEVTIRAGVDAIVTANRTTIDPGQAVSFSGAGSQGQIAEYNWDFDDGATSLGQSTIHQFNETGVYQVALTVTSTTNAQAETATVEIVVGDVDPQDGTETDGDAGLSLSLVDSNAQVTVGGDLDVSFEAENTRNGDLRNTKTALTVDTDGDGRRDTTLGRDAFTFPGSTTDSFSISATDVSSLDPGTYDFNVVAFGPFGEVTTQPAGTLEVQASSGNTSRDEGASAIDLAPQVDPGNLFVEQGEELTINGSVLNTASEPVVASRTEVTVSPRNQGAFDTVIASLPVREYQGTTTTEVNFTDQIDLEPGQYDVRLEVVVDGETATSGGLNTLTVTEPQSSGTDGGDSGGDSGSVGTDPAFAQRSVNTATVSPGESVTVTLQAEAQGSVIAFEELYPQNERVESVSIDSVEVNGQSVQPTVAQTSENGTVVAVSGTTTGDGVTVTYTLTTSGEASLGDTIDLTGSITSGSEENVALATDVIELQEDSGSSLSPQVAQFDANGDGSISISELGTAVSEFSAGDIGISILAAVVAAFSAG